VRELTGWSKDLRVTADADDVVSMVGAESLRSRVVAGMVTPARPSAFSVNCASTWLPARPSARSGLARGG